MVKIFIFLVLVNEIKCQGSIPTPEQFLEQLLNTSASAVMSVASSFGFKPVQANQVQFLRYDRDGSYQMYHGNMTKLPNIDSSMPTKFVIHGWRSKGTDDWVVEIAKSYHKIGIINVFSVDWSFLAEKNYLAAAGGVKHIGEIVAEFIWKLLKNETKHLSNVHLIGHSLGAQVSGFAGKKIKDLSGGAKVKRITGLDAAAPLFEYPIRRPDSARLADGDGKFVDGIHTNAGFLGYLSAFGDADFYVEFGGPVQPGCEQINIIDAFSCSHSKSHTLFNNTITSESYKGTSCEGPILAIAGLCLKNEKVPMGEPTPHHSEGEYYVRIDSENRPKEDKPNAAAKSILDSLPGLKRFESKE